MWQTWNTRELFFLSEELITALHEQAPAVLDVEALNLSLQVSSIPAPIP